MKRRSRFGEITGHDDVKYARSRVIQPDGRHPTARDSLHRRGAGPDDRAGRPGGAGIRQRTHRAAHIQSGRLRPLGIASPKRSAALPDLPTLAESGVPGYSADAVLGLLVTARTPRAIVELLNAEVHKAMRLPELIEAMRNVGVEIAMSTLEEFGRLIESEIQRWGKVVRGLKLKVE